MATNYITTGQHQIIHGLLRELELSADDLAHFWKVSGTARTYAAAARMITLLKVKNIYKHLQYDADDIRTSIREVLDDKTELEHLSSQALNKLYARMQQIENNLCNPVHASQMVAVMKVSSTVVYDDMKEAIHACDKYDDESTLKVLFTGGRAVRFSIGGQVFEPINFWQGE